jgi:GNAT superfamily N-acetyltransferase
MTEERSAAAVTVRTATLSDEDKILSLIEQLFEPPGGRAPGYTEERGREGVRKAIKDADSDILLAVEDGRIVGLASVYRDILSIRYGQRCWLQDLVVADADRSRGIGRVLLDAASDWARERGCTHLQLSSGMGRVDAHRFYAQQRMMQSYCFERWLEGPSR